MGEIGAGNGSSYPASYDTDNTVESDSTFVRYQIANDWSACILAIEQEMGINPAGAFSTIVARLDDADTWATTWRRTGTTVHPYTLNDNVQISGTLGVGLGTTAPSGTVEVNGSIFCSGTRISATESFTISVGNPTSSDDFLVKRMPYPGIITAINGIIAGGTNLTFQVNIGDGDGGSTEAACTATTATTSNAKAVLAKQNFDAGDYLTYTSSAITGSPTQLLVTVDYTVE